MSKFVRLMSFCILMVVLSAGCASDATKTPTSDIKLPSPTITNTPPTLTPIPETATPTEHIPTPTATQDPTQTPTLAPTPRAGIKIFEGAYNDRAFDVLITSDGGTLIVGISNNTQPSHRITPGKAHLIRTDAEGNLLWEKDYGGEMDASFSSIIETAADEFVILGEIAASYIRDETDMYLVKVDGTGNEIWSHTYGSRGMDFGKMVQQTADGGYILVGDRADEHPTDNLYESNLSLIKTDTEGNEIWARTYGDQILYLGWGIAQTPDGGFILSGWEAKTYDDRDIILIKTDASGAEQWSRTWDPGERDGSFDLILASDGYVVMACIQSMGSGAPSARLIKVDLEGNEIWNKLIGKEGVGNTFWHIIEDTDGGYVMVGDTHLEIQPVVHGALAVKTNPDGEIIWQRVFGEGEYQQAHFNSAALLPEGGYIFVGDVTPYGESYSDIWWVKVDREGHILSDHIDQTGPITAGNIDKVKKLHTLSGYAFAFHPAGDFIATGGLDGSVKIWRLVDGALIKELTNLNGMIFDLAYAPDGQRIAAAIGECIKVINVANGETVVSLQGLGRFVQAAAFSPDGSLLTAGGSEAIKIWNTDNWEEVAILHGHTGIVFDLAFTSDGTRLISSCGIPESTVIIWNTENFKIVQELTGHAGDIHSLAISPDGQYVISGGTDPQIKRWNITDGQSLQAFEGYRDVVYGLAYSHTGDLVAAGCGSDNAVIFWDSVNGAMLVKLQDQRGEVLTVKFSPDGRYLASSNDQHEIIVWGLLSNLTTNP